MKQNVLGYFGIAALLITTFTYSGCKKEDSKEKEPDPTPAPLGAVTKEQKSLLVDISATWCGMCGAYGCPLITAIGDGPQSSKVVILNMQASSSQLAPYFKDGSTYKISNIQNQLFWSLGINVSGGSYGLPAFSLNGTEVDENERSTIESSISTYAATNDIVAGVAGQVKSGADDGNLTIETKVKFFKESTGDYYLSMFILEDDINQKQTNGPAGYVHKHVVRAVVGGTLNAPQVFGANEIATGTQEVDKEIAQDYTFSYQDLGQPSDIQGIQFNTSPDKTSNRWVWKAEKMHIAFVLWKKEGSKYTFVNASTCNVK
ncbi:MAG: Omp28-related outer membrane protein [Bacteroidota bacterium]